MDTDLNCCHFLSRQQDVGVRFQLPYTTKAAENSGLPKQEPYLISDLLLLGIASRRSQEDFYVRVT